MSNLSIVAVLHRLRAIKTLLHDGETKGADICIDDMIKKITNNEHICTRCGCQISINDCHAAGDYCESCSVEINANGGKNGDKQMTITTGLCTRQNGKSTLMKNLVETINGSEKVVSQSDFKGHAKRYKWVVADGKGVKRYFINKPRLIDHINGIYHASYLGDKVTAAFRKKQRYGLGYGDGYKYLGNIASDDGILRRED